MFKVDGIEYDSLEALAASQAGRPKAGAKTEAQRQREAAEREALEAAFQTKCIQYGLPTPATQFMLAQSARKFRWDFAWPDFGLLVEVNGGIWSKKRKAHSTGGGIARDYEKANEAARWGWRQLTCHSGMIEDETVFLLVEEIMHRFGKVETWEK